MEETEKQCAICTPDLYMINGNYPTTPLYEPPTHKYSCNAVVDGVICTKRHDAHLQFGAHVYDQRLQKTVAELALLKPSQIKTMLKAFKDDAGSGCAADMEVNDGGF